MLRRIGTTALVVALSPDRRRHGRLGGTRLARQDPHRRRAGDHRHRRRPRCARRHHRRHACLRQRHLQRREHHEGGSRRGRLLPDKSRARVAVHVHGDLGRRDDHRAGPRFTTTCDDLAAPRSPVHRRLRECPRGDDPPRARRIGQRVRLRLPRHRLQHRSGRPGRAPEALSGGSGRGRRLLFDERLEVLARVVQVAGHRPLCQELVRDITEEPHGQLVVEIGAELRARTIRFVADDKVGAPSSGASSPSRPPCGLGRPARPATGPRGPADDLRDRGIRCALGGQVAHLRP